MTANACTKNKRHRITAWDSSQQKQCANVPQCALAFESSFSMLALRWTPTPTSFSQTSGLLSIAEQRTRGVALTGSERAGEAFVVLDDADMDTAVKWGVWGTLFAYLRR